MRKIGMDMIAMENIGEKLKKLRISAIPKLSIRRMADELGVPVSSYVYFEDPKRYKKSALPLDFTRKVADILQRYAVDPLEVMKLAGLSEQEAVPEAKMIESSLPPVQYVPVAMAMPSEAALKDMFRALLVLVPDGASKDEIAAILARRLPTGFAAIGPYWLDRNHNADAQSAAQSPAEEPHEAERPSRTQ